MEWHKTYDDPDSSLTRRLSVVQRRLEESLAAVGRPSPSILSLCAGDGRDAIPVLSANRFRWDASAVLVELDERLAAAATSAAAENGLASVDVRCRDAADPSSFIDALPVDVLLLCGIFGNIAHDSVRTVIEAIPLMLREGGFVIWTRGAGGREEPDRRPEVRRWFRGAGLPEVAFDGEPETYGVGVNTVDAPARGRVRRMQAPLFQFLSE